VREVGLEPTRLAALEPKSSASANFATHACLSSLAYVYLPKNSSRQIFI